MTDHPLRYSVARETHARPHIPLHAPLGVSHYAFANSEGAGDADRAHLLALCDRFALAHPPPDTNHFSLEIAELTLRWERHTEFTNYTLITSQTPQALFGEGLHLRLPADWWETIPGQLLVATHLSMLARETSAPTRAELARVFAADTLCASVIAGDKATVWSDLRLHGDGSSRILVHDTGLSEDQTGRIVQRLLELETYRSFALLSLPLAREVGPKIRAIDLRLEALTNSLSDSNSLSEQKRLLGDLTDMWAELEDLTAQTAYRFSATTAYAALVHARCELFANAPSAAEESIKAFMLRRFDPAIRTCTSVAERQEALSTRLTRTANLLRTRVEVAVEEQNSELLGSMNRRTQLQLRLQETVEGLSVAAITYYVVGLVGYLGKAINAAGISVKTPVLQGISVPIIAIGVWLFVRRVRRGLEQDD